jgi:hypothetical protein
MTDVADHAFAVRALKLTPEQTGLLIAGARGESLFHCGNRWLRLVEPDEQDETVIVIGGHFCALTRIENVAVGRKRKRVEVRTTSSDTAES